jgi:hypothetical protein
MLVTIIITCLCLIKEYPLIFNVAQSEMSSYIEFIITLLRCIEVFVHSKSLLTALP